MRILIAAALCVALNGCVVSAAAVGGGLVAAAQAVTAGADVIGTIAEARQAIAERDSVPDKAAEFRRQYCARPALRAKARGELAEFLEAAGVPAHRAAGLVEISRRLGERSCL